MKKVEIPTKCPICNSTLSRVKMQLFCENDLCEGRIINKIAAFCKKLKIKGLAIKSLEKLELESISDLYSLDKEYLVSILGKNGEKIYREIQDSLNTDIQSLIGSLGIRLVGMTTAAKLKGNCLTNIDYTGLPDKAKTYFKEFLTSELYSDLCKIPFNFNEVKSSALENKGTICLSGKFDRPKKEIEEQLIELGYLCTDTLTKATALLVVSDKNLETSKTKKAIQYNINIKTLEEIINE